MAAQCCSINRRKLLERLQHNGNITNQDGHNDVTLVEENSFTEPDSAQWQMHWQSLGWRLWQDYRQLHNCHNNRRSLEAKSKPGRMLVSGLTEIQTGVPVDTTRMDNKPYRKREAEAKIINGLFSKSWFRVYSSCKRTTVKGQSHPDLTKQSWLSGWTDKSGASTWSHGVGSIWSSKNDPYECHLL